MIDDTFRHAVMMMLFHCATHKRKAFVAAKQFNMLVLLQNASKRVDANMQPNISRCSNRSKLRSDIGLYNVKQVSQR